MGDLADLHTPNSLRLLLRREAAVIASDIVASLRLRLGAVTHASFIHPRARLVHGGGISIGAHCQVYAGATLCGRGSRRSALMLGRYAIIRENAYVDAHGGWIELAEGTFVGQNAVIYGQGGVEIGRNSLLSPGVTILSSEHQFDERDVPIKFQPERFAAVTIGSDCWLGANTVVLAGVSIGQGTIVGAGSVVTKRLPAMVVAHGNPARVTRVR